MDFDKWMKEEGLADSSVSHYHNAVKGVLSDWANEAGIINTSLMDISDPSEFFGVALEIQELQIFKTRDTVGKRMYSAALKKYAAYLDDATRPDIKADIKIIMEDQEIKPTFKSRLIDARIGQGKYRRDLLDLWGCCCITGYSEFSLLTASHIKPWSKSSDAERLDKFNGLLLLPNLDKAFDYGLISFKETGKIILSSYLRTPEILGINSKMYIKLKSEHRPYIEYHRSMVFKSVTSLQK